MRRPPRWKPPDAAARVNETVLRAAHKKYQRLLAQVFPGGVSPEDKFDWQLRATGRADEASWDVPEYGRAIRLLESVCNKQVRENRKRDYMDGFDTQQGNLF